MPIDSQDFSLFISSVCSFIALLIGAAGFIFGVYTHFSTKREARLTYSVMQLTDYKLPDSIISSLHSIPFVIEIKSDGNKQVENVRIRIETASHIDEIRVEGTENHKQTTDERKAHILITQLNPGETVKISGQCAKLINIKKYVEDIEITHSEGKGQNTSW